uniref:Capsid protein n=1 Tax=Hepeviridae sp. TaxID=2715178 RepID=A0A6M3YQA3_9VIRU|nr:MAG: capsid protein [Hepeviridae sp.]QJI53788.1 MAG: capsid protein [Hepeviridae sp.]
MSSTTAPSALGGSRQRRRNRPRRSAKVKGEASQALKTAQKAERTAVVAEKVASKLANTTTPSLRKFTSGIKMTSAGRAWLHRYINPCHNDGNPTTGIPDALASEAAIVHSRVDDDIKVPPGLETFWAASETGPSSHDWFLGIVVPPWIDDCVYLFAANEQPTQFDELSYLVDSAPEYPMWGQTDETINSYTVFYSKIQSPMIPTRDEAQSDTFQVAASYRCMARGVTTYLIADKNNDRGAVSAAQWSAQFQQITTYRTTTVNGETVVVNPIDLSHSALIGEITPKHMTAASSRAYTNMATAGAYMPVYTNDTAFEMQPFAYRQVYPLARKDVSGHLDLSDVSVFDAYEFEFSVPNADEPLVVNFRVSTTTGDLIVSADAISLTTTPSLTVTQELVKPITSFTVATPVEIATTVTTSSLKYYMTATTADDVTTYGIAIQSGEATAPTTTQSTVEPGTSYTLTTESVQVAPTRLLPKIINDKQNIGVIWYQGISGAASIKLKGRLTLQAVVEPGSRWEGFAQPTAKEDLVALEVARNAASKLQNAYPAKYNDNGLLSGILKNLVSKVPVVGGLLSGLI